MNVPFVEADFKNHPTAGERHQERSRKGLKSAAEEEKEA